MKPKIIDQETWQQAELLMQPALIRLVDNLRKQLDHSDWEGTYEAVELWPAAVTTAEREERTRLLQSQLQASGEELERVNARLQELPEPYLGHQLCLNSANVETRVDLWQLCYQICFQDYSPQPGYGSDRPDPVVTIDQTLLNSTGEIDWEALEHKTIGLVNQLFTSLPS